MIYRQIVAYLSDEWKKGKTYQAIANEHGLSFGYIRDLVTGRRRPESMSLSTFFKIFPAAQIRLADSAPVGSTEYDRLSTERDLYARELELMRLERDSLRRELETYKRLSDALDARVHDLERRPPRYGRSEEIAPYHAGPATLSPSTKTGASS